jgi:hypothetical protein
LRYLFVTELHRERFQGDPEYFLNAATGSAPSHSTDQAPVKSEPATTTPPSESPVPKAESAPPHSPDADPNVEEPEPVK